MFKLIPLNILVEAMSAAAEANRKNTGLRTYCASQIKSSSVDPNIGLCCVVECGNQNLSGL